MDDPESLSESDSNEENNFNNLWNIDPKREKQLWSTDILENYIYFTGTCPFCFHKTFKIF